ncbi:hypothetical protein MKX01_023085 [Papaver californicum]|nr:hypothetical protein MKX01_023085 [Papaver californicum]
MEQIKNRYSVLRGRYNEVKKIMSLSGFEWDPEDKKIIVDDEGVWDAYLKKNPDKKKYKTIGCHIYEDLCTIFGYSTAMGFNAFTSADNIDFDTPLKSSRQGLSVVGVEELSEISNEKANERGKRKAPATNDYGQTKRATSTAGLSEALFAIADATKAKYVTDLDKDPYSIPNCTKYLQSLDGVRVVEESWVLEFARGLRLLSTLKNISGSPGLTPSHCPYCTSYHLLISLFNFISICTELLGYGLRRRA